MLLAAMALSQPITWKVGGGGGSVAGLDVKKVCLVIFVLMFLVSLSAELVPFKDPLLIMLTFHPLKNIVMSLFLIGGDPVGGGGGAKGLAPSSAPAYRFYPFIHIVFDGFVNGCASLF